MDSTEKKNQLKALLVEEKKPKTIRRKTTPAIQVTGNNAQIAGRDINHNTTINHINTERAVSRPKIEVKTGDGVVTAEQKARLQQLVKDCVDKHNIIKKS